MIDFEQFVEWAETRFDDVVVKGDEVRINSIFTDDEKQKLWCNPYGGKHNRPFGVYHCWKTEKKGSLVSLVMHVDSCEWGEALDIVGGVDTSLADLEKQVDEILGGPKPKPKEEELEEEQPVLKLPNSTYYIDDLPDSSFYRVLAETYLLGRKLPIDDLMICTAGEYRNRIVIPYYDRDGELIYFNSRYIGTKDNVIRYKFPPKEIGIAKGDVIYCPKWPMAGGKIYLTEGEFDAYTLHICKFAAGAFGGKHLTENQLELLRSFRPVICVDSDKAGTEALAKIGETLLQNGFAEVGFVRPPRPYKDWNEMLQKVGPKVLAHYVRNKERRYGKEARGQVGDWDSLDREWRDFLEG